MSSKPIAKEEGVNKMTVKDKKNKVHEESEEESHDEEEEGEDLAGALGSLPPSVLKRVLGLRKLHDSMGAVDDEYKAERIALEIKYREKRAPFLEDRRQIVAGQKEVEDIELPEGIDATAEETETKGIPSFWLQVLGNNPVTGELITEDDIPALTCLEDIKCEYNETYTTFTLCFEFRENEYFSNTVFKKSYTLSPDCLDDKSPSLIDASSTPIEWKEGKNLLVKEIKKKQKAKSGKNKGQVRTIVKQIPRPSFFHYFSQPKSEEDEEENEDGAEEEEERITLTEEEDFDVAHTIRTYILPDAILWYTGEAREDDDFAYDEGDEDDEDGDEDAHDDDDDEDDEPAAKPKKGKGGKGFAAPSGAAPAGGEQPECKQN